MNTIDFTSTEFSQNFHQAISAYNEALDSSVEAPLAAKEFMAKIFNSNPDTALEYQSVLENLSDAATARKLQDIVFNSEVAI
ncbi:MAG: hypothetical protein LW817_07005 [Candidatus Caenarcaniphilales bacterium]|nr:hypothetical protein [Candidatus Caenarcaniphilales bacterium]